MFFVLNSVLATSNTVYSIQNFNYLLQFHLWNILSSSAWSPSISYSSKTVTVHIQYTNLCHPSYKHKNIWWKIIFLCWPLCLEQFASNTLILPPLLKPPSRCTCLITISKLSFFTAIPTCVCVGGGAWVHVIVKCPVLQPCAVDGRSWNHLYYYHYYCYVCRGPYCPWPELWQ